MTLVSIQDIYCDISDKGITCNRPFNESSKIVLTLNINKFEIDLPIPGMC
jgi:hypothetical protein